MISTLPIASGRVDLNIMKVMEAWPKQVTVLTDEYVKEIPYVYHRVPLSVYDFAVIDLKDVDDKLAVHSYALWHSRHERIIQFLIHNHEWRGQRTTVYNATWAFFGYIRNQEPDALKLMNRVKYNSQFRHVLGFMSDINAKDY